MVEKAQMKAVTRPAKIEKLGEHSYLITVERGLHAEMGKAGTPRMGAGIDISKIQQNEAFVIQVEIPARCHPGFN